MLTTCGDCVFYLTDEDNKGIASHAGDNEEGYCAIRDLFTEVKKGERSCPDFCGVKENETPRPM